mgnify:CR=1 FL=1
MIDSIHERLLNWAEASGGVGAFSTAWAYAISGEARGEGQGLAVPFSMEAYETEKAVQALPVALKLIVNEFYLNSTSTLEQKLKALGMSKRTLYRRLDMAHGLIETTL